MRLCPQGTGEAFTEVQPGGVWSSENTLRCADLVLIWGRLHVGSDRRERSFDTAESKTLARLETSMHGTERPCNIRFFDGSGRSEKARGHNPRHARYREVTQFHSTEETSEQRLRVCQGRGVRGGKELDQGEPPQSLLAPDTEPGTGVTGIVACT